MTAPSSVKSVSRTSSVQLCPPGCVHTQSPVGGTIVPRTRGPSTVPRGTETMRRVPCGPSVTWWTASNSPTSVNRYSTGRLVSAMLPVPLPAALGDVAAVDAEFDAGDERGGVGAEPGDGVCHLLRPPQTPDRVQRPGACRERVTRLAVKALQHRCLDHARTDGVDAH